MFWVQKIIIFIFCVFKVLQCIKEGIKVGNYNTLKYNKEEISKDMELSFEGHTSVRNIHCQSSVPLEQGLVPHEKKRVTYWHCFLQSRIPIKIK